MSTVSVYFSHEHRLVDISSSYRLALPTQRPPTNLFTLSCTMKFTALLSISAIAASALAQTLPVPEDLADGVYLITIDNDGSSQITKQLANVTGTTTTTTTTDDSSPVSKRRFGKKRAYNWPSGTYPYCPGGNWFLQNDFYNRAFDSFWNTCASLGSYKIPAGARLVAKQGTSVAYMCAFTTNPCNTNEFGNAVDWTAGSCAARSNGWMEPGE